MALWVVVHHTSPRGIGPLQIGKYGYFAVDVFFILSGFVLAHSHASHFDRLSWPRAISFWNLRLWRVYPLYLASVLLSIAVFRLVNQDWPEPLRVLESLAILDIWARPGIGLNGPAWSLGVEVIGYLLFPLIVCAMGRLSPGRLWAALAAVTLGSIAYVAWIGGGWHHLSGVPAVVRMATEFGIGCLLFALRPRAPAWLHRRADLAVFVASAGFLGVLLAGLPLLALPFLVLLVYGVASEGRWTTLLLGSRPALFLGRISFALYITHQLVQIVVVEVMGKSHSLPMKAAGSAVVIVASIGLAMVLCLKIEEPIRRWVRGGDTGAAPGGRPASVAV